MRLEIAWIFMTPSHAPIFASNLRPPNNQKADVKMVNLKEILWVGPPASRVASGKWRFIWILRDPLLEYYTPRKINMEPENRSLEKENHLPNHHFQVDSMLIFRGVVWAAGQPKISNLNHMHFPEPSNKQLLYTVVK